MIMYSPICLKALLQEMINLGCKPAHWAVSVLAL